MTYGSELAADPQYAAEIHALARDLRRRPLTDGQGGLVDLTLPETIERLRAAGYTYVYSGAQPIARSWSLWVDLTGSILRGYAQVRISAWCTITAVLKSSNW
jgi:hypothetical protein